MLGCLGMLGCMSEQAGIMPASEDFMRGYLKAAGIKEER